MKQGWSCVYKGDYDDLLYTVNLLLYGLGLFQAVVYFAIVITGIRGKQQTRCYLTKTVADTIDSEVR